MNVSKTPEGVEKIEKSGLKRKLRPAPAPGSVHDLTTMIRSIMKSAGIAYLQNVSIPPDTPPRMMMNVSARNPIIHGRAAEPLLRRLATKYSVGSTVLIVAEAEKRPAADATRYLQIYPPNVQ